MHIGATTWGQQWFTPAIDARATSQLAGGAAERPDPASGIKSAGECTTCRSRKYSDGSSDSTVSFQTPTKLSPEQADTAVRSHEQEHVVHEQVRARESGQRVVSQSVAIHSAICPECGRSYVSGGTTTTVTKPQNETDSYTASGSNARSSAGAMVDLRV